MPWWGNKADVTLHTLLVHMTTETHRHAGHADIVRVLIDGSAGYRESNDNLPAESPASWSAYHTTVQRTADQFR